MSKERGNGKGSDGKKERKGASGKVEKDGRRPTGPFKVPRRQQRASNELIKLSNSFGLASERANKCSPLPRGPLQRSRAPSAMSQIYARSSTTILPPLLDRKPRNARLSCKEKILLLRGRVIYEENLRKLKIHSKRNNCVTVITKHIYYNRKYCLHISVH